MDRQNQSRTLRLMKKLNLAVECAINRKTAQVGLTAAQGDILLFLMNRKREGESDIRPLDLCHETGISKAGISSLLKKLRTKGYLVLEPDPLDERQKHIRLTGQVEDLHLQIEEEVNRMIGKLFQNFTDEEAHTLERLLNKMYLTLNCEGGNDL